MSLATHGLAIAEGSGSMWMPITSGAATVVMYPTDGAGGSSSTAAGSLLVGPCTVVLVGFCVLSNTFTGANTLNAGPTLNGTAFAFSNTLRTTMREGLVGYHAYGPEGIVVPVASGETLGWRFPGSAAGAISVLMLFRKV